MITAKVINMNDPALVDYMAQISAINAEVEAMKALNKYREMRNETIAYDDDNFFDAAFSLRSISEAIGKLYSVS